MTLTDDDLRSIVAALGNERWLNDGQRKHLAMVSELLEARARLRELDGEDDEPWDDDDIELIQRAAAGNAWLLRDEEGGGD